MHERSATPILVYYLMTSMKGNGFSHVEGIDANAQSPQFLFSCQRDQGPDDHGKGSLKFGPR